MFLYKSIQNNNNFSEKKKVNILPYELIWLFRKISLNSDKS